MKAARGAAVALLIMAAMLAGCSRGPTASAPSAQSAAPGSFAVHMNGTMTTEAGTAHP
ncbi:MAG TPA: hypothetical protein VMF62_00945 [Acetobacteraceae bacterium]|nr:hypothetical protein [Acetobacteraceae bacterium]